MRWYPKLGKYTENFGGLGPRLVWPEGQNKAFYTVFPILAIFFMFNSNLSKTIFVENVVLGSIFVAQDCLF